MQNAAMGGFSPEEMAKMSFKDLLGILTGGNKADKTEALAALMAMLTGTKPEEATSGEAAGLLEILKKLMMGQPLTPAESEALMSALEGMRGGDGGNLVGGVGGGSAVI